jgi:hypothetical protein
MVAGALVVVLVLALPKSPLVETAIPSGLVDWQQTVQRIGSGGGEGPTRLAVQADMGNYLNNARETELFRVRSPEPLLWRGGTLDYFDGARSESTALPGEDDGEEIAPTVETRRAEQSVTVTGARTDVVFGGYRIAAISGVEVERRSDGSWAAAHLLSEGSTYRVVSEVPQPSKQQLQQAGTGYPAKGRQKFLQLPEEVPETARRIRGAYDANTPYEKARSIERYLLYDGGFAYNLHVDYGRAHRTIEEFLGDSKESFCVQFISWSSPHSWAAFRCRSGCWPPGGHRRPCTGYGGRTGGPFERSLACRSGGVCSGRSTRPLSSGRLGGSRRTRRRVIYARHAGSLSVGRADL